MAKTPVTMHLRTSRDGALSALGHDLDLRVGDVDVTRQGNVIRATVETSSIQVFGVVKQGKVDTSEPAAKDRQKIEGNLHDRVLKTSQYTKAEYEGEIEGDRIRGKLTLCGITRPINLERKDGQWRATIHQPDFGIEPYSALMGQLRVAANVEVLIDADETTL
jgi:hypothetical protein